MEPPVNREGRKKERKEERRKKEKMRCLILSVVVLGQLT
jgi:hypothetical protein